MLSARDNLIYDVIMFIPPLIIVTLNLWWRFLGSQRLTTTAARVYDFIFVTIIVLAMVIIVVDVYILVLAMRVNEDPDNHELANKMWIIAFIADYYNQLAWILIMWGIKGCLYCLYVDIRNIGILPRYVKILIVSARYILILTVIPALAIFALWCSPIQTNWSMGSDHCSIQTSAVSMSIVSGMHLLTDAIVLGIPILIFRHIPLRQNDRSAFYFVVALGAITCSIGVVCFSMRIGAQIIPVDPTSYRISSAQFHGVDPIQERSRIDKVKIASLAEVCSGLVVMCLPSLRVLYRRIYASATGKDVKMLPLGETPTDDSSSYRSSVVVAMEEGGRVSRDNDSIGVVDGDNTTWDRQSGASESYKERQMADIAKAMK